MRPQGGNSHQPCGFFRARRSEFRPTIRLRGLRLSVFRWTMQSRAVVTLWPRPRPDVECPHAQPVSSRDQRRRLCGNVGAALSSMQPFNVPAGAQILLGAPAKPMPPSDADAIASLVARVDGVQEAHLPQCFVVGVMESPAQILVVLLDTNYDASVALNRIGDGLTDILSKGKHLDVWPVESGNSMLNDVRSAGCEIYRSTAGAHNQKPWWRFW